MKNHSRTKCEQTNYLRYRMKLRMRFRCSDLLNAMFSFCRIQCSKKTCWAERLREGRRHSRPFGFKSNLKYFKVSSLEKFT